MPEGYTLLPTSLTSSVDRAYGAFQLPSWVPRQLRLRPRQIASISLVGFFASVLLLWHWNVSGAYFQLGGLSSTSDIENFDDIFLREAQLPQHNLSLSYPEGSNGRYVRFSNQVWGLGWNNILQERLLNTILAYESNRAPVFSPFEAWAHPPRDDKTVSGDRQVLVIPYNALLSGPTAGAPWPPNDPHPRAITQAWWETVCPPPRRHVIDANQVMKEIGQESDGIRMLNEWTKVVRDAPGSCVEITGTQVFDFFLIGATRILSLWDIFSTHPVIQNLKESDLVNLAVAQNLPKLRSNLRFSRKSVASEASEVIPGLVAVHIRRGDYLGDAGKDNGHCLHFAKWGSTVSGWNQLTQLPDKFIQPPRGDVEWGHTSPEIADYYLRRCLPTPTQAVARIRAVQAETKTHLGRVFIATNAEPSYLFELRTALVADGWAPEAIVMSTDLELGWRGVSVGVAVDMSIMVRAQVFIGNGFSSLSSNVVMRRLTTGRGAENTRLW
ncbi:hypothetical protein BDV93DRAFT_501348 [Ceratobasidium sp. AG-I]|nr:hypothetical protein BDV93DRAFT_501348 [Ceratobasidium sp. AG-I]